MTGPVPVPPPAPPPWRPTYAEVIELTAWMAANGHSASDVAYAVEKPWKHADLWVLYQAEKQFESGS